MSHAAPAPASTHRKGMAGRKCFTPPKIGVLGKATSAMGPAMWTARKKHGDRSTSAHGRNQDGRRAAGASSTSTDDASPPRRRRRNTAVPTAASTIVVTGSVNSVETKGNVTRRSLREVSVGGKFQFRPRYSKL